MALEKTLGYLGYVLDNSDQQNNSAHDRLTENKAEGGRPIQAGWKIGGQVGMRAVSRT